ncbi:DUF2147 domain-containing protein [Parasphingorhabdus sp.]|uniref:DUF2147 domain-containing protein n=1 Tax=Parasphingorhabdus sp. TaxID=2709688 RepID=UPI0032649BF4
MANKAGLKISVIAGLTFLAGPALASGSINGQWVTQEGDAIIKIGPCGKTICGRIAKYLVTPPNGVGQRDINNPNKKLRNRKLLGTAVLTGFKLDGDVWRGRIYDPKTGKSYRSEVSLQSASKLKVKGCIAFFCQGQNWTRAE